MRALAPAAAVLLLLLLPLASPSAPIPGGLAPPGLRFLRGDLHAHTCFSDGSDTPARAFGLVQAAGVLDFFAVTEHSEWLEFPFCADADCVLTPAECLATPVPERTEWEEVLRAASAATHAGFVGLRGFEWSHPEEGHVNVWGTEGYVNFLATPAMPAFYAWLAEGLGGGDGLASFNHPGREPLMFDGFAYHAGADARVAGLEVYNRGNLYEAQYVQALDKGWRVAALGVSDGHGPGAWLNVRGHTVVLAAERTEASILGAVRAMRTFATNDPDLQVVLTADGALMGSTVQAAGLVALRVQALDPTPGDGLRSVALVGAGGTMTLAPVGGQGSADVTFLAAAPEPGQERWFYAKVEGLDGQTAHTAPVWVRG